MQKLIEFYGYFSFSPLSICLIALFTHSNQLFWPFVVGIEIEIGVGVEVEIEVRVRVRVFDLSSFD